MVFNDDDELELICLCADKLPCRWRVIMSKLDWVTDLKCPIRKIVRDEFEKIYREKYHKKIEQEYPEYKDKKNED